MLYNKSLPLRFLIGAAALAGALALGLPALANDTGGGGGGGGGGGSSGGGGGGGGSSSSSSSSSDAVAGPTMADARSFIKANKYANAIAVLKKIVAREPGNADALNLLGFSLRMIGDTKDALAYYEKALAINPNHKGAHEYLGELYVITKHMDKAKSELDALAKICGNTSCEEYEDLAGFIKKGG